MSKTESNVSEELFEKFKKEGFLLSPSIFMSEGNSQPFLNYLKDNFSSEGTTIITKEVYETFLNNEKVPEDIDLEEHREGVVKSEKESSQTEGKVEVKFNYEPGGDKKDVDDWVNCFKDRYEKIKDILKNRAELQGALSIKRALGSKKEDVAIIGMVKEFFTSNNDNFILTIEDPTGEIKGCVSPSKDTIEDAHKVVEDEVIGIKGTKSDDFIYIDEIIFPNIPNTEGGKTDEEVYAVFTSDFHIGSKMFLESDFKDFLKWLKGETGSEEQREISSKVKYLFIVGDLVDGVGIYPNQQEELDIRDINEQFQVCADFLKEIPDHINIIICPGNHDGVRIAEPQPKLSEDFAAPLYELDNVTFVSNPSVINVHKTESSPGLDILLYHGYSLDHFATENRYLREGGYERVDKIMEFLLEKRHLAPKYGSTRMAPTKEDFLVIQHIPDVFATAHIHKAKVSKHKNIVNVCCSCFQDRTSFQEKVGHKPEPAKIPILNLKTKDLKIMEF